MEFRPITDSVGQPAAAPLMAQALAANARGDFALVEARLVELLQSDPGNAQARHLLGAEYASAGRIDDALAEMGRAVELDPGMTIARFQYGLLMLTSGRGDDALVAWEPLDRLGNTHVLNRFRAGMLLMVDGNLEGARRIMSEAMADNIEFPALNSHFVVVLEVLAAAARPMSADGRQDGQHVLLSSYQQSAASD